MRGTALLIAEAEAGAGAWLSLAKTKNDLHALGHLTVSCQKALPEGLEIQASYLTTILAEKVPPHQKLKK